MYYNFLLTDLHVRPPGGFSRAMARTTQGSYLFGNRN